MKIYTIILTLVALLTAACSDHGADERLSATVTVSLKASEQYDTRTSEVLLFDAGGYFEGRYTDRIEASGITLTTESGTHHIVVMIGGDHHTVTPQEFEPGITHISGITATPQTDDNPHLWVGCVKRIFRAGQSAIEIRLTKASSVAAGITVNPWTYREQEVNL